MSFSIPPQILVQRGEPPTVAAISTQVWSDKEVISAWVLKVLAGVNEAPPVQNDWYVACDLAGGVLVYGIMIAQGNDEVAVKDLEVRYTVDAIAPFIHSYGGSASGALSYDMYELMADDVDSASTMKTQFMQSEGEDTDGLVFQGGMFLCTNFKAEIRITSAVGTNQLLTMMVRYALKEAV